ncbi:nitroreductase family protein [Candidatus Haliotispira prima]|uniref:Nitroreductase family protein n=1 Tax=Candidatus Haliotispira prima TaxID=3034016 RepID=A0ABY8MDS1_9SPIO|nr:nitroreductase family protein [Candidatus Haliotispira prima]
MLPQIQHRNNASAIQDKDVPKEVLDRLLRAGRLSPSIKNRQPWRFIAINDIQKKLELQEACYGDRRCKKGALIAACYATSDYEMPNGFSANLFDLGLASGQIMLQAEKEGLAAESLTSFSQSQAGRILTLPHGMYIAAIILLGYPAEKEKRDMSSKCLPSQRTINYNSW